jgi:EAL domain-containing protein (putative c-di-GMP-specific phosphodiesterase class I)/ActR/RegA family two-component response regulator
MVVRRLLVIDDDPMIGQLIQRIAEMAAVQVRVTPDPAEFFRLLEDWDPTHLAIDLIMPDMDGVEVMIQLARLSCQAKIIITSGIGNRVLDAAGRAASEHGLDIIGVLAKPFSPGDLRALLADDKTTSASLPFGGKKAIAKSPAASAPVKVLGPLSTADIKAALDQGLIHVAYQPKVSCKTGLLAGFEALARWQDPRRGWVSPGDFIPIAESTGLINVLTEQVIEQTLAWFTPLCLGTLGGEKLPPAVRDTLKMAINISARTLSSEALFDRVRQQCELMGLSPERFIFELTETSTMTDPTASLDLLTRLRIKGFYLSIDDFGTGYSSMLQLVRLPVSEIKIDQSFVMTAMKSEESRTVIKFIVDLGHSLGLQSTAEGVEDEETLAYLREIGCDLAQGYWIGRPMSGDDVLAWIKTYNPATVPSLIS